MKRIKAKRTNGNKQKIQKKNEPKINRNKQNYKMETKTISGVSNQHYRICAASQTVPPPS